jgi:hypothetical protein
MWAAAAAAAAVIDVTVALSTPSWCLPPHWVVPATALACIGCVGTTPHAQPSDLALTSRSSSEGGGM